MADKCEKCGAETPFHLLDAKPPSLADVQATWDDIHKALDAGEDFTVLQCRKCYGPAWEEGLQL